MGAFDYFKKVYREYANFEGRARRKEYWYFVLFYAIINVALSVVDVVIGMQILSTIFALVSLVPSFAVGARRLHDINKSGWWQLIGIIPVIGWIVLIWFFAQKGTDGVNRFGPDPLAE